MTNPEEPPKNKNSKKRKNDEPEKNKNKNRKITMPLIIQLESLFEQLPNRAPPIDIVEEEFVPFENENDYPPNGETQFLNIKIENINDLIELGLNFKDGLYNPYTRYNINLFKVAKLVLPLQELNKMIGMNNIKRDIFDILMYQLQEFDNKKDMLHTIIEGEPGVGKTELTKIIAKVYQCMGYLTNKTIKKE